MKLVKEYLDRNHLILAHRDAKLFSQSLTVRPWLSEPDCQTWNISFSQVVRNMKYDKSKIKTLKSLILRRYSHQDTVNQKNSISERGWTEFCPAGTPGSSGPPAHPHPQGWAVVPGQCRDPGPVPPIPEIGTGTRSHGTVSGQIPAFRDKKPAQSQDDPAVPGFYGTGTEVCGIFAGLSRMVVPRDKRDRDKNRGTVPSRPLPIPGLKSRL